MNFLTLDLLQRRCFCGWRFLGRAEEIRNAPSAQSWSERQRPGKYYPAGGRCSGERTSSKVLRD